VREEAKAKIGLTAKLESTLWIIHGGASITILYLVIIARRVDSSSQWDSLTSVLRPLHMAEHRPEVPIAKVISAISHMRRQRRRSMVDLNQSWVHRILGQPFHHHIKVQHHSPLLLVNGYSIFESGTRSYCVATEFRETNLARQVKHLHVQASPRVPCCKSLCVQINKVLWNLHGKYQRV